MTYLAAVSSTAVAAARPLARTYLEPARRANFLSSHNKPSKGIERKAAIYCLHRKLEQ
jgi:hypothetical protein